LKSLGGDHGLGRFLEQGINTLVEKDLANEAEVGDDKEPRDNRDATAERLYQQQQQLLGSYKRGGRGWGSF
jgi:hypothetical protein